MKKRKVNTSGNKLSLLTPGCGFFANLNSFFSFCFSTNGLGTLFALISFLVSLLSNDSFILLLNGTAFALLFNWSFEFL